MQLPGKESDDVARNPTSMTEHEASRTLVKSPPELWAELSDQASLASHLADPFGEIRITRLEPETAVAWEGDRASGTVRIEPSGWGTRVTLTARAAEVAPSGPEGVPEPAPPEPAPLPVPDPPPEPLPPAAAEPPGAAAAPPAAAAPRQGLLGRLRGWLGGKRAPPQDEPPTATEPEIEPPAAPEPAEPAEAAVAAPAPAPAPAQAAPAPAPAEAPLAPVIDPAAVLVGVLDRLGAAHHRPFSRP